MSLLPTPMGHRLELSQIETNRLNSAPPSVSLFSLADVLAMIFKYKVRLATAFLVPVIAAVVLVLVLPPVYRAQTSLVVGTGREYLPQGDGNATNSAPSSTKQEFINTEIELLGSRAVSEATINHVGLQNLYPALIKTPPTSGGLMDAATRKFKESLRLDPVKLSNVIQVTFDHDNPQAASRVLDQFISSFQDLHSKVFSSRRAASYEETIARDMEELEKLEHQRATIKASAGIFDIGEQRTALLAQRTDAQRRLQETIDNAENLRRRLDYLAGIRPQLSNDVRSTTTDVSAESVHANEMLVDMRQKEAALLSTYPATSPVVSRLRQQITALQETLKNMRASTTRVSSEPSPITTAIDQELIKSRTEMAPLQAQKERYEALVSSLSNELQRNERADMLLRILNSRIEAQNENLKDMRRLYDQARAQDEMDSAKVTSVVQTSHATTSDVPVAPSKLMFLGGGILAGLIASAGALVLSLVTNRTFFSEESVERISGLPVLASVRLGSPHQRSIAG